MSAALFRRLAASLFGAADSPAELELVAETIDAVVDAVEPRLRSHEGYREKLDACVRHAIAYLRSIARGRLEPVLLTRAAWKSDPRVHAFFASDDELAACLAHSAELNSFFNDRASKGVPEAYALLGMKKEQEKFSGHRIVAPAPMLAETRLEVGRRIMLRLAQVALSSVVAADAKATELESRKAYLAARIRLLELAADGMEGIVKDPARIGAERQALERELGETVSGYIEAKGSVATLEGYLRHIDEVFSHPERHVALTHTPLRGRSGELDLAELSIGPDFRAAISIVLCPRPATR